MVGFRRQLEFEPDCFADAAGAGEDVPGVDEGFDEGEAAAGFVIRGGMAGAGELVGGVGDFDAQGVVAEDEAGADLAARRDSCVLAGVGRQLAEEEHCGFC